MPKRTEPGCASPAGHRAQEGLSGLGLIVLAAAAGVLVTGIWLWWHLLSPYGYQPPADLVPAYRGDQQQVFVYGTLRNPVLFWLVTGQTRETRPAVLPGYRKQGLDVVPAPGEQADGLVFEVDTTTLRRLDRYERLGLRYDRVELTLSSGETAWVYRRLAPSGQATP